VTRSVVVVAGLFALLGIVSGASASAQGASSALSKSLQSSTLTGDWGGARSSLAENGITFDVNVTQVGQGVVDGGKDSTWEYGGRGNVTGHLDTQKAGLWPGGFLTVELEGNWTSSVNNKTGAFMPVNTNQLFPLPKGDNFGVPNLSFAQFLSPYFGLTVGKLDTMSGDANDFAHGKGDTQFLNTAMSINPVALVVPYSTLGGGLIVLPTKDPTDAIVTFLVLSASGKATTTGFDELDSDNLIFTAEGRVRTGFFGHTGHQLLGGLYSNRSYTSIDQRLGAVIDDRFLNKTDDTWAVYYNFDQYLYESDAKTGRGFGLFGRFGASEGNPNPAEYFFSVGLGGKGVSSREHDRFGAGFYYIIVEEPSLQLPFSTRTFLQDEFGFEFFYNVALTPWMLLTPDLQVIEPAQKRKFRGGAGGASIDTAVVLGFRIQLIL
jgi:porin